MKLGDDSPAAKAAFRAAVEEGIKAGSSAFTAISDACPARSTARIPNKGRRLKRKADSSIDTATREEGRLRGLYNQVRQRHWPLSTDKMRILDTITQARALADAATYGQPGPELREWVELEQHVGRLLARQDGLVNIYAAIERQQARHKSTDRARKIWQKARSSAMKDMTRPRVDETDVSLETLVTDVRGSGLLEIDDGSRPYHSRCYTPPPPE